MRTRAPSHPERTGFYSPPGPQHYLNPPSMLKFHRRVVVYAPQSERIVLWASAKQASALVSRGQAIMHTKERKVIRTIQLTGQLIDIRHLGLRPGSFGIDALDTGNGRVYSHKRYPRALDSLARTA